MPEIFDAGAYEPEGRISPADQMLDDLGGKYLKLTDVAKLVKVHPETLRRLCRTDRVKAPSKMLKQGGMTMYLFTQEDVEEVLAYFAKPGRGPLRSVE